MTDIYSLSLNDITPQNIAKDDNVSSLIAALDPELQDISRLTLEPLIMARIDELPDYLLDLLAAQLHVDFYDLAEIRSMKLEAVKGSILWHMHKGTEWAIHEALRMVDIKAEFVHWRDSGDAPYTFRLKAIISGDYYRTKGRDKLLASIHRAVNESKAARSLMSELDVSMRFTDNLALYAGVPELLSGWRRISFQHPKGPGSSVIYSAAASLRQGEHKIGLDREKPINSAFSVAPVIIENRDYSFGVERDTMQELLRLFEKRILERIDLYEKRTQLTLDTYHAQETKRLDEILDLLRWADDFYEDNRE